MRLQTNHPAEINSEFLTLEQFVLHLIHKRAYLDAALLTPGPNALDWGCNDGWGMAILEEHGLIVSGLDTNPDRVLEAQCRLPHVADRILTLTNGVTPFPSNSFNLVASMQVVEHLKYYDEYFSGICKVLRKDGVAVFTTPNRRVRLDEDMPPWNPYHITEFSPEHLYTLLRRHFRNVQILGLQADADLYSIEYNRCQRALKSARNKREHAANIVPSQSEKRRSPIKDENLPFSTNIASYSVDQLWYEYERLDVCLDLMAVCRTPA